MFCILRKSSSTIVLSCDTKKSGTVGLATSNFEAVDLAYDVLGLEALFLVPRTFSLLSLNPYFGTLVSRAGYDMLLPTVVQSNSSHGPKRPLIVYATLLCFAPV